MIACVQCSVRRPEASALLLARHAGRLWPCSRCSRLGLLGALEMRCCFLPSARFFPLAEAQRLCPHQSHHHLHHHHDHHRLQLVLGGLMHPPHHLQPFCFFAFLSLSLSIFFESFVSVVLPFCGLVSAFLASVFFTLVFLV